MSDGGAVVRPVLGTGRGGAMLRDNFTITLSDVDICGGHFACMSAVRVAVHCCTPLYRNEAFDIRRGTVKLSLHCFLIFYGCIN